MEVDRVNPEAGRPTRPESRRLLAGAGEAIFQVLPQGVLANLRRPASENALLWNLIYPLATPTIALQSLQSIPPLWGSALPPAHDDLVPYFWGYDLAGSRLTALDETLEALDGPGQRTEVDLFLLGERNLIVVEAKHLSAFGRCRRFSQERCPPVHGGVDDVQDCRYWRPGPQRFLEALDFGEPPAPGEARPACAVHYQLARTLMVARELARRLGREAHLWLMVPGGRWRMLEKGWLDFVGKVREDALWRRMRVLAWEEVRQLAQRPQASR